MLPPPPLNNVKYKKLNSFVDFSWHRDHLVKVFQHAVGLSIRDKDTDSNRYQKRKKHRCYHYGISCHESLRGLFVF